MPLWHNSPMRQHRDVSRLTPYFRSRDKQKRICPQCRQAPLQVWPTLNPNAGIDRCPTCRYFQCVVAPKQAQVPHDWTPPTPHGCRIIAFQEIARR